MSYKSRLPVHWSRTCTFSDVLFASVVCYVWTRRRDVSVQNIETPTNPNLKFTYRFIAEIKSDRNMQHRVSALSNTHLWVWLWWALHHPFFPQSILDVPQGLLILKKMLQQLFMTVACSSSTHTPPCNISPEFHEVHDNISTPAERHKSALQRSWGSQLWKQSQDKQRQRACLPTRVSDQQRWVGWKVSS